MQFSKKAVALATGFIAALSVVALAQNPASATRGASGASETLVLDEPDQLATLEWIERADVAALREGVIKSIELWPGSTVAKKGQIGVLHKETADLTVAKAKLASKFEATKAKALAQEQLALQVVATNRRLNMRDPNMVSKEEMLKAEAEVNVAHAMAMEADEQQSLNIAELALAEQAAEEHIIRAPFAGVIYDRLKNPGESVRANEAVVRLGNLDRLRAWSYVPLEYAYRVKEGQIVEIQPRLQGTRGAQLAIEQKRFRGKITFVDPQIQAVAETAVRIFAEFENKDHLLKPGLKAVMTIYMNPDGNAPAPAPAPTVGSRTGSPGPLPR
jgi:RND family efflux transporter MFP subunit